MWLTMDELLTWKPQRDVAKPYPAAGGDTDKRGSA
jgi:hypothetical protein